MANMVNVRAPNRAQRYQAPEVRYGRSQFSLAHNHKTTFDGSYLIPHMCVEVVPGDTMTMDSTSLVRIFSPLEAPIMDDVIVELDFFYTPNRLVWDNWEYFLGAHDQAGAQDTTYVIPVLAHAAAIDGTNASEDLVAYFGIPQGTIVPNDENINALPFRMYNLIYNEWYRDQNLIDQVNVQTDNGDDTLTTHYTLLKSAKVPDYFTTALPYLQKGSAQVAGLTGKVGIATDALDNEDIGVYQSGDAGWRKMDIGTGTHVEMDGTAALEHLYADFTLALPGDTVGGISINALREAAAVQRLLEKDAQAGTRLVEIVRAHFGVTVPDLRVGRPLYLGGGKGYINVSPIANTSGVDSTVSISGTDEPQGELRGTAVGVLRTKWAQSFTEHGFVIGILRARAPQTYQHGLDRMWSRQTKTDYLWPELAGLGEQPIYQKEIWIEGDATDDDVFGYQERYAEYRFQKSMVSGLFHSDATGSIDYWHLAEDLGSKPTLNQTFIEDATPFSRIVTDTTRPDFIADTRFDLRVARILPVRPNPSLVTPRF